LTPRLTVILPAFQPHPGRLARTLAALSSQTLPAHQWQLIVVDNASQPPLTLDLSRFPGSRFLAESRPGLSHARRSGVRASSGDILVFVDDDNVLAPDYLEKALGLLEAEPRLGALGGKSLPEFECPPPDWIGDLLGLLALRDPGPSPVRAHWDGRYPACSPIGAGMVLRRPALESWLHDPDTSLTDRCGKNLASGGDNDLVLHILKSGWSVGYAPELVLTHLIPSFRLREDYLARLSEAMQATWMRVLTKHGCNEWPPIPRWSVPLRQARAFMTHRAWAGPAQRIAWRGACGHFAGRSLT
jgi:glycosyltransferase involved in cell wall biosynthesis